MFIVVYRVEKLHRPPGVTLKIKTTHCAMSSLCSLVRADRTKPMLASIARLPASLLFRLVVIIRPKKSHDLFTHLRQHMQGAADRPDSDNSGRTSAAGASTGAASSAAAAVAASSFKARVSCESLLDD